MHASPGSQQSIYNAAAVEALAVEVSELDTKLVTAKRDSKLCSMVYGSTSGMA